MQSVLLDGVVPMRVACPTARDRASTVTLTGSAPCSPSSSSRSVPPTAPAELHQLTRSVSDRPHQTCGPPCGTARPCLQRRLSRNGRYAPSLPAPLSDGLRTVRPPAPARAVHRAVHRIHRLARGACRTITPVPPCDSPSPAQDSLQPTAHMRLLPPFVFCTNISERAPV